MAFLRRRANWMAGRYGNVDGIPFRLPVATKTSPAIFAGFSIDAAAAQAILPGQELHAARLWNRGILIVAIVDYQDTTIGTYVELCLGIVCTRGARPAMRLLPTILQPLFGTGVYIHDLPVSTEISVKGGLGIWGMPKRKASLDFQIGPKIVSSQYDLDGELVARLDVSASNAWMPFAVVGAAYGTFRGMLGKSYMDMRGRMGFRLGDANARLVLGDHPRAAPLKTLDISPRPIFTGFIPKLDGILEDHIETWFMTSDAPPGVAPTGLADVIDLSLGQDRLLPPNRGRSDAMIASLTADQLVGRQARPSVPQAAGGSRP